MPITDLTNTKWYFNGNLNHNDIGESPGFGVAPGLEAGFYITFTANNKQYTGIDYCLQDAGGNGNYVNYNHAEDIGDSDSPAWDTVWEQSNWSEGTGYSSDNGWVDESYRTITITGGDDVTNPDLITWLTKNATQVSIEDTPSSTVISYNDTVIATVQPGETATLECAGMKMDSNIVIEAAEASGESGSSGGTGEIKTCDIKFIVDATPREGMFGVIADTIEWGRLFCTKYENGAVVSEYIENPCGQYTVKAEIKEFWLRNVVVGSYIHTDIYGNPSGHDVAMEPSEAMAWLYDDLTWVPQIEGEITFTIKPWVD